MIFTHAPRDRRRTRHPSHSRRAFTVLEVMLASMLGLLVVLTAIGLFGTIRKISKRSEETYERRMELALAQEAIERATRTFIMSGQPSPRAQPSAPTNPARAANRNTTGDEGATADPSQPAPGRPRVILQPDPRFGQTMRWIGPDGRVLYIAPQRMEVTLSRPPVFAPPTLEELLEESLLARQAATDLTERRSAARSGTREERRAARDRASGRSRGTDSTNSPRNSDSGRSGNSSRSRSGSSRSGSDTIPGGGSLEDLARRAGFDPAAVNRPAAAGSAEAAADGASEQTAEENQEVALAPGIRGVFELQWDPDDLQKMKPDDTPSPDGGTWSLWWRLINTEELDVLNELNTSGAMSAVEQLAVMQNRLGPDPQRRGLVRLASKLTSCRWEAVRSGETVPTFSAYFQEELPAFFTLEVETISGQWMKWMFEVDWSRGEEPGTALGTTDAAAGAIPVLSDLPVIGNQFRNGSNERKGAGSDLNNKGGNR